METKRYSKLLGNAVPFIGLLLGQTITVVADQCNVVPIEKVQRADLSCCDATVEPHQCFFTSKCNSQGVCCTDPTIHEDYLESRQMAQPGHCCVHAGDCMSGICIGGACWAAIDHSEAERDHEERALLICIGIVAFMVLGFCVACCCMRSLKMQVKVKAKKHDWNRHRGDSQQRSDEVDSQRHELSKANYQNEHEVALEIDAEVNLSSPTIVQRTKDHQLLESNCHTDDATARNSLAAKDSQIPRQKSDATAIPASSHTTSIVTVGLDFRESTPNSPFEPTRGHEQLLDGKNQRAAATSTFSRLNPHVAKKGIIGKDSDVNCSGISVIVEELGSQLSSPGLKNESAQHTAQPNINYFSANMHESNNSEVDSRVIKSRSTNENQRRPTYEQYNLTAVSKNEMTVSKQINRLGQRQRNSVKNPPAVYDFNDFDQIDQNHPDMLMKQQEYRRNTVNKMAYQRSIHQQKITIERTRQPPEISYPECSEHLSERHSMHFSEKRKLSTSRFRQNSAHRHNSMED